MTDKIAISKRNKLFIIREVENHGGLYNPIVTETEDKNKPGEWIFRVTAKRVVGNYYRVIFRRTKEECETHKQVVLDFENKVEQKILERYNNV